MSQKKSTPKDRSITVHTLRVRLKDKHARLFKRQAVEVNMVWNFTQECSNCHQLTGPKGQAGLGIRQWTCVHCLISLDRDVNAAINILNRRLEWLQMECSIGVEARAGEPSMNMDSGAASLMAALGHGCAVEGIIAV